MIGVFDSGIGGLTVVKKILKYLPGYQIIYFGDTARLPYGTKGGDFIRHYSEKITHWLIKNGARIIIIACHTSSVWSYEYLKKKFKIPIFEVITPAIKEILSLNKNKRIGVIGTPSTIKSGLWKKKLLSVNNSFRVYSKACPLFVPLVEEGWIKSKVTKEVAKIYLKEIKQKKINTLVLACTHYPMLKETIQKEMGREVKIINPADSLAKELKLFLENNPYLKSKIKRGSKHKFFFSDEPYNLKKINKLFLKEIKIKPIIVKNPF